ncbi:hypothetical protein ACFXJ5_40080 [Streptomyces sp. NPDC059373]
MVLRAAKSAAQSQPAEILQLWRFSSHHHGILTRETPQRCRSQRFFGGSETRHAEMDRRNASKPLALFAFLTEEGEGELDALDLSEPALLLGTGPASQEICLDLVEARQHLGVDVEHGTSQTSVRCSLLRPEPSQRARLVEIRDNLLDRIAEAEREGWLGEIEGLRVSLAGAIDKLTQVDRRASAGKTIELGLPHMPGTRPGRT